MYTTAAASVVDVCSPSPCGPHSNCRVVNGHAVCACQPGCIGHPPNCRLECTQSIECAADMACVNQKCVNPCPGTCTIGARCRVINHQPRCDCQHGYTGDGFKRCYPITSKLFSSIFYFHYLSISLYLFYHVT
jgi:hypothetical protein